MLHPQTHYLAHGASYDGNGGMPFQRHAYRVCQQRTGAQVFLQYTEMYAKITNEKLNKEMNVLSEKLADIGEFVTSEDFT